MGRRMVGGTMEDILEEIVGDIRMNTMKTRLYSAVSMTAVL